jgi:tetratricopeptide (TPR) repeat protein
VAPREPTRKRRERLQRRLKLAPRDAQLWADRGRARAARQDWANAENDLSAALAYDKTHPDIYVLRAAARHAQGNTRGYKTDIDSALSLDPTFPEALVERGAMKMDAGDAAGARADFLQVLLRAPDSAAAGHRPQPHPGPRNPRPLESVTGPKWT